MLPSSLSFFFYHYPPALPSKTTSRHVVFSSFCRRVHVQAVEGEVCRADPGGKPAGLSRCRFPSWSDGCPSEQLWVSRRGARNPRPAQAAPGRQAGLLLCPDPPTEQVSPPSHWQPRRLQVGLSPTTDVFPWLNRCSKDWWSCCRLQPVAEYDQESEGGERWH